MPLDATQTFIVGTGHFYIGAVGSSAPTNATTAPDAAFVDFGYTTEDGLAMTITTTTERLRGLQSFFDLRRFVTDVEFSWTFTLLQHNYETLKLFLLGGTATGSTPNYKVVPGDPQDLVERALIIDLEDGDRIERWYAAGALITPNGEVAFGRNAAAQFAFTAEPLLSEGGNAVEWFGYGDEFSAT